MRRLIISLIATAAISISSIASAAVIGTFDMAQGKCAQNQIKDYTISNNSGQSHLLTLGNNIVLAKVAKGDTLNVKSCAQNKEELMSKLNLPTGFIAHTKEPGLH